MTNNHKHDKKLTNNDKKHDKHDEIMTKMMNNMTKDDKTNDKKSKI